MASWEQFLKEQADRASTLIGNSVARFRQAIDAAGAGGAPGQLADLVAKNAVLTSKEALDLAFEPFNLASPQPPVMYFTSASGVPPKGVVRLASDTTTAAVTVTKLFQLGTAGVIDPAATPPDFTHNVVEGSILEVTLRAGLAAGLAAGFYQGVATVATQPVAVILFEKL
jgi:hypothetical protein